jgi:hypothetical protein
MARMAVSEARGILADIIDGAHRAPDSREWQSLAGQAGGILAMIASGFGFDRADVDYLRTEGAALQWAALVGSDFGARIIFPRESVAA